MKIKKNKPVEKEVQKYDTEVVLTEDLKLTAAQTDVAKQAAKEYSQVPEIVVVAVGTRKGDDAIVVVFDAGVLGRRKFAGFPSTSRKESKE